MSRPLTELLGGIPSSLGPVLTAVERELLALAIEPKLSISERSPFGRRAIRLHAPERAGAVAQRLLRAAWVEEAVAAPPNVYLRPDPEALEAWFALGKAAAAPTRLSASIDYPDPTVRGAALDALRQASVGRGLAAMLRSSGVTVVETEAAAVATPQFRAADHIRLRLAAEDEGAGVELAVAGVDVTQGALRARHGGALHVADLMAEISGAAPGSSAPALAAFLMLRCERGQRLVLDEARLKADLDLIGELSGAAPGRPRSIGGAERVDLILAAAATPAVADRALEALDPYVLCRHLRNLVLAGGARLPAGDPLHASFADHLRRTLQATGMTISREPAPTPAQPTTPGAHHAATFH